MDLELEIIKLAVDGKVNLLNSISDACKALGGVYKPNLPGVNLASITEVLDHTFDTPVYLFQRFCDISNVDPETWRGALTGIAGKFAAYAGLITTSIPGTDEFFQNMFDLARDSTRDIITRMKAFSLATAWEADLSSLDNTSGYVGYSLYTAMKIALVFNLK